MSHFKLSARLALAVPLILAAACSGGDRLVGSLPADVSSPITVTRGGLEGLRQDIADLRSLPADLKFGSSTDIGISRDELASGLETHLKTLSRVVDAADWPVAAASGSWAARFSDVAGAGDVGGAVTIRPLGIDSRGYNMFAVFAYTSCNQGSMVVARVEVTGSMRNFRTGNFIGPIAVPAFSAPNYASTSTQQGLIYPELFKAEAQSKHMCKIGLEPYPTIYRSAFAVM